MKSQKKHIGLVGLGYWGKNTLRNLYAMGALHTACDSRQEVISQWKKKFPDVNYTTSSDDILKNQDIKAIAIATPAATHYEFVKCSLLAGKDVFVEKPLALTVREGEELIELSERENKILMVGHILQYHPAVIKLKELVSSGTLGKVQYIYSNRLNMGKLRTEENILWSFAPHDISIILMLLEEEPVKVSAFGGDYLNNGIYDTTLTTLEFKNSIKGHIFVSWLHPYKEQKLIVVGSKTMAVFDDLSNEKLFIYPHKIEWENGKIPVVHKADYETVPLNDYNGKEPLRIELDHFLESISKRTKPKTDGIEGLKVLRILESAEKELSKKEKKIVETINVSKRYFTHESAFVDDNVEIGKGTKIWHFSHILSDSKIGESCTIGQNVMIGPDVEIGDRCKIQNNVSIYKGVKLEDEIFCGPSCVFTNVFIPRAFIDRKHEYQQTLVKKGATLGANATILCGITIGEYALVGAGAVVTKEVKPYALVVGVPAKQLGWVCKCGATLKEFDEVKTAVCNNCDSKYEYQNKNITALEQTV